MANRILCSTGAVIGRPNGRDFRLLKDCVRELKCDGFEFMMYESWYGREAEILELLKSLPTEFSTFHVEKSVGNLISRNEGDDAEQAFEYFKTNCLLASALGSDKLVLHLWGGLASDRDIDFNFACYDRLREISDGFGLELTVENVVCNCKDPMSHLLTLAKMKSDARFTFDTKMAAFHSQLDELYSEENRWLIPQIRHMHINDYSGGHMDWSNLKTLHVCDGHIDFGTLFAFLRSVGYNGDFTVEATSFGSDGVIDFDALNRTFERIRSFLSK